MRYLSLIQTSAAILLISAIRIILFLLVSVNCSRVRKKLAIQFSRFWYYCIYQKKSFMTEDGNVKNGLSGASGFDIMKKYLLILERYRIMNIFLTLAYLFFIGAVLGWILEVFFRKFFSSSNPEHRWINPGFCVGPYIPLYGCGLCILFLLATLGSKYGLDS